MKRPSPREFLKFSTIHSNEDLLKYATALEEYCDLLENNFKPIIIPIQPHWAGDYRIEYDGKYITLFGKDKNYEGFRFNDSDPIWYEEMVLNSCVVEVKNAEPIISFVSDDEIHIILNVSNE